MSITSNDCNDGKDDGASKSNDDGVCEMNDMLQNMSTADVEETNASICANCGKVGSNVTNTCNKCKSVKYCNAACKKKHRHKHKKDCEEHQRLAAEHAAKLQDEALFRQPPPVDDCPICFQRMPSIPTGSRYKSCCGKLICSGCIYAVRFRDGDVGLCPFCRTPAPTLDKEIIRRINKRVEAGDIEAIYNMGCYYNQGDYGFPQDYDKALELWQRAGELGHAAAYHNIGCAYDLGRGVKVDNKKANHYYELAATKGDAAARHNLGSLEARASNFERAVKHYTIAASGGYSGSLEFIKVIYKDEGHATKEDYSKALRLYQEYLGEVKSVQRDEAAAADEQYRYY